MIRVSLLTAALALLAVSCSPAPPGTPPPQPTETVLPPTPTSTTHPTSTSPAVLPRLTLEGNGVMWSGDPPPISDCRITFCDGGVILEALIPLSGLAQPAYVSDYFGDRTIRRAEADGDGFTLSAERECPVPPTPTAEIACTLEAAEEYTIAIAPWIAVSNEDLEQYLWMLDPENLWYEAVYGDIVRRHMEIQAQLRTLNIPPCLGEVHDEMLSALGYRFSAYNAFVGIPRPDPARLQAWLDGIHDLADESEAHLDRAGDLMRELLLERFGIAITPTP